MLLYMFYFVEAFFYSLVMRLNCQSEFVIFQRIVVPAINMCFVRQGGQLLQRVPHCLCITFEQPAATADEQRITGPENSGIVIRWQQIVANRRVGMPRCCNGLYLRIADSNDLSVLDEVVDVGYPLFVTADDSTAGPFFQFGNSADVVPVVMGGENGGEIKVMFFQCFCYRRIIAGIDCQDIIIIVSIKINEVISKCRDRYYFVPYRRM